MARLINLLEIDKCPHCNVDKPNYQSTSSFQTRSFDGTHIRFWRTYTCNRCGGVVLAFSSQEHGDIIKSFPESQSVDESIPERAREYLKQAIDSLVSPSGSIVCSASSVDAMLKEKGYKDGSLYNRIDKAKDDHLITEDMAKWAHQVRLDANDQRHSDEKAPLPNQQDAQKCINFTLALGQFLFVLPASVTRGLADSKPSDTTV